MTTQVTKTTNAKGYTYAIAGTTISKNDKRDYKFALVYSLQDGTYLRIEAMGNDEARLANHAKQWGCSSTIKEIVEIN